MKKQLNGKQFLLTLAALAIAFWLGQTQVSNVTAQAGTGIIRVATTGNDVAGCGSEAQPCRTIQYVVDIANSGDTIRLAAGTYAGGGAAVVVIDSDSNSAKTLTIVGGYSLSDWNTSDPTTNFTLIDGQNTRRGVYIDARNRGANLTLQGLTLQNGRVTGGGNNVTGGGIYCVNNGALSLFNVIVKNNVTQGSAGNINAVAGGGVAAYRCALSLQNVTFDSNQAIGGNTSPRGAQSLGGGLFVADGSSLGATNLTLTNNQAIAGSGGIGYGSNISDRADALGGGAAIMLSTATINGLTATNNQIVAGSGSQYGGFADGGGLFFEGATATVSDGLISDNTSTGGASSGNGGEGEGAAIMAINKNGNDSQLTLNRLTIVNNTATGGAGATAGRSNGGAITLIGTQATATNLIIADNVANAGAGNDRWGGGGGVYISRGTNLTLNHATLARNSVFSTMLAPALLALDGSTMTVNYSIIANHTGSGSGDGAVLALSGADRITLNYTLFSGNTLNIDPDGSGIITNSNAQSGSPAFVSPGSPNFNYHLTNSSAAKDKAVGSTTSLDIDQDKRPFGSLNDLGADEFTPPLMTSSKSVSPIGLRAADGPDHQVTYTLIVRNNSGINVSAASLSDTLPTPSNPQITFNLASGPTCSSGTTCSYNAGTKTISWGGDVNAGQLVTITYVVAVNFPTNYASTATIQNTANLQYRSAGDSFAHNLSSWLAINPKEIFLPIILK